MELMLAHQLVGRSAGPSPCSYAAGCDISGLATNVASSTGEPLRGAGALRGGHPWDHPARRVRPTRRSMPQDRFRTGQRRRHRACLPFSKNFSFDLHRGRSTRPGTAVPPPA